MADQAEAAFLRVYINTLGSQPVTYKDDYQQPPGNSLKKVPVLQIPLPAPPRRTSSASASSSSVPLTLTFKSLKPPLAFTLAVHPTDTVAAVKAQLAAQKDGPSVPSQRLLLKGKALADAKLLKEYPIKDGDTINLMLKAVTAPTDATPITTTSSTLAMPANPPTLTLDPPASGGSRKHQRIPSVVLSPSPSSETPPTAGGSPRPADITLTLDSATEVLPERALDPYHAGLAKPALWQDLVSALRIHFPDSDADVRRAFEDLFGSCKSVLSPSEIAFIRGEVGITGMGGA
ncbi:hypothetical protein C8R43DRAFT_900845 [Mycena crocata]|nr:hypothetical protein C8R43DRAFT_900845 [Mycena crocata]